MLTVALLPGLLAAGIGSLVFVGIDSLTGLGTFSLAIPDLPPFTTPTGAMFAWAIVFGLVTPLIAWAIRALAQAIRPAVHARRVPITTLLGLAIALLAIVFAQITGKGADQVLFSGQDALPTLITEAGTWSLGALAVRVICKVLADALSLSAFRGGPIFPSMVIGAAIGVAAANLPGLSLVPAVGMGSGAMCVSMLSLPFTSALLATVLLTSDGYAVLPLVIVAIVVAYVAGQWLPPVPVPAGRTVPKLTTERPGGRWRPRVSRRRGSTPAWSTARDWPTRGRESAG